MRLLLDEAHAASSRSRAAGLMAPIGSVRHFGRTDHEDQIKRTAPCSCSYSGAVEHEHEYEHGQLADRMM